MSISFELPKIPDNISAEDKKTLATLSSVCKKVFAEGKVDPAALRSILEDIQKLKVEEKIRPILSEYSKVIEAFANKAPAQVKQAIAKPSLPPLHRPPLKRPPPIATRALPTPPAVKIPEPEPELVSPISGPVSGSQSESETPESATDLEDFEEFSKDLSKLAKRVTKDKLSPKENDKLREDLKEMLNSFDDKFEDFKNIIRSCNTLLLIVISEPLQYSRLSKSLQTLSDAMKTILANKMKPPLKISVEERKEEDALQLDTPQAKKQQIIPPTEEEPQDDSLRLDSPAANRDEDASLPE
jgi:hypothetical protein